ncbi:Protein argonaute 16 [Camellia lanceoleosa]|uniref:Protein argonaute 16 n=1 Tax=Camellia lanceoleosa TaxID=1840588 RepID=A0ACC0H920_9ERIC|nr:Protein argonaute 16 [Camellia lanceoleosa]
MDKKAGGPPPLPLQTPPPPPPPIVPPNVKPEKLDPHKRSIISRHAFGSTGRRISLLTNHFKVSVKHPDKIFYQYTVSISSEDNRAVESKGFGRKVVDKLYKTYSSELAEKGFAYDGEKSLYTVGPLPQNNFEFTVVLGESFAKRGSPHGGSLSESGKRSKRSFQSKTFKVELSYAAKIPLKSISLVLQVSEPENILDTLRALDIILRQQAANRQSFFHDDSRKFTAIGGGITGCRGFHSSFRPTHGGLSLNMGITPLRCFYFFIFLAIRGCTLAVSCSLSMLLTILCTDVSTTMILTPEPLIDFLLANQTARDPCNIDWAKAKRMLKNMRVKTRHRNMEFKITGLSEKPCNQQFFPLKVNNGDGGHDGGQTLDITVYEYFTKHRNIEITNSEYTPCIDVGKPERPNYLPLEAVRKYHYYDDPLLVACGISIERQLTQVDGRVLEASRLKVGNSEDCVPHNGQWNFNKKQLLTPIRIEWWVVVNFSACCDTSHLSRELINCGRNKGIHIERPHTLIEEDPQYTTSSPLVRVEKMFELITAKLPRPPEFLLCVLPERKNSDIYGPWKKKSLSDFGIATQCISPTTINDQYLANVLPKINTKLFWDGVSESQFHQALNNEAYQHLGEVGIPMFTVIVAQKNHHTKLFQASAPENVPPGTVVDTKVVHPRNYDFYMCAQAGMIGTSRPAHYHVLLDEIGFSPDDLENFIHSHYHTCTKGALLQSQLWHLSVMRTLQPNKWGNSF